MKRTRWLALGAVAALLAWLWWAFRPSTAPPDASTAATPSSDIASAAPTTASESSSAREAVRAAGDRALDPAAMRSVRLQLLRFPDEAPLATVQVEIAPLAGDSASKWVLTDSTGQLQVEVTAAAPALDVHAAGYEPLDVQLESAETQLRVLLTPSSGLFGRVVDGERAPVAGAQVRLEVSRRTVQESRRSARSGAEIGLSERRSIVANGTTNAAGFYYLAYATTTSAERVRVLATTTNAGGALDVELPRVTTQLDDLGVSAQRSLAIRVVDTSGTPVADARVWSLQNPRPTDDVRTGSDGIVTWFAPILPASFGASAANSYEREQRSDGRVVKPGTKVESLETRVELVLESAPSVRVKVLDAETRQAIFLAQGMIEFVRKGRVIETGDFEPDARGEAAVLLVNVFAQDDAERDFDTVRVSAGANDYLDSEPVDIDPHASLGSTPIELLLQPEAGTVTLHGRVVRGSQPVADLQLGVKVQRRSDGSQPLGWEYKRAYTDAAGRFSARWPRNHGDQVVSVFPHVVRWDEFGFIGPLDVDVAIASEQVLELKTALAVPAILRGVSKGGRYRYYVSIVDGEVAVSTTVNGAPLTVDTDGEARVTLLLPSDRRSRVSVGYVTESVVIDNHANAVEFDPAHATTPLVFELQPFFADISGRAVGFTADEIARISVAFVSPNDSQSRMARCNADATFRMSSVPRASGDLLLLIDGASQFQATVLARMSLVLEGDVGNLQLTRDPASLPETSTERR